MSENDCEGASAPHVFRYVRVRLRHETRLGARHIDDCQYLQGACWTAVSQELSTDQGFGRFYLCSGISASDAWSSVNRR